MEEVATRGEDKGHKLVGVTNVAQCAVCNVWFGSNERRIASDKNKGRETARGVK